VRHQVYLSNWFLYSFCNLNIEVLRM
jgi:hypothetical protein